MSKKLSSLIVGVIAVLLLVGAGGFMLKNQGHSAVSKRTTPTTYLRKQPNYRKSSEIRPYPRHLNAKQNSIVVSTRKQRAYLMRGRKVIYEFYVSTGKNVKGRRTPKGHYRINNYRARWFYSPSEHEGARDAVGWHDYGLYLFHETPSYHNGKIIKSVARDLGKRGSSYGCIHLSISDARWFYQHAPTGMRVTIH